jgi:hypothetical protein
MDIVLARWAGQRLFRFLLASLLASQGGPSFDGAAQSRQNSLQGRGNPHLSEHQKKTSTQETKTIK